MSASNLSANTSPTRTAIFGTHEDDRPASKRATRDAVVRLTRLGTPELEEIAKGGGVKEQLLLNAQSTTAAKDALEVNVFFCMCCVISCVNCSFSTVSKLKCCF
jgi:hypothetical protein